MDLASSEYLRCRFPGYHSDVPSTIFASATATCGGIVAVNTVATLLSVIYVCCAVEENTHDERMDMKEWWMWGRYFVMILLASSCSGYYWAIDVLNIQTVINWPDYEFLGKNQTLSSCGAIEGSWFVLAHIDNTW